MADFVSNIALGRPRYYYDLVDANAGGNEAFLVCLFQDDVVADATLRDYDDLAAVLGGSTSEADFTNYVRLEITGTDLSASSQDDSNDRLDLDCIDFEWDSAGGASNNDLGKLGIFYCPDTTALGSGGSGDDTCVPVFWFDFVETTTGSDIIGQVHANGLIRITS